MQNTVELFTFCRMNFKGEYLKLKPLYPDIDKISKLCHFKIVWIKDI
jgi:hypothetical protein